MALTQPLWVPHKLRCTLDRCHLRQLHKGTMGHSAQNDTLSVLGYDLRVKGCHLAYVEHGSADFERNLMLQQQYFKNIGISKEVCPFELAFDDH